jgi:hypothetical protein
MDFNYIIEHLERKKPKKGRGPFNKETAISKPLYEISEDGIVLCISYNYYWVNIIYDKSNWLNPYCLDIEKPCVIDQQVTTKFNRSHWHTLEDVWLDLQQKWKKTLI